MASKTFSKMMILGLLAGGLFVSSGAAKAQTTTVPVQNPWAVKIGALFPTNSSGSRNGGSAQLSVGADYSFEKTTAENPTIPEVYFDYNGGSRNGGHVDTYALGIGLRAYGNHPAGANQQGVSPYVGLGIGAYYTDLKNGTTGRSGTSTDIGGKIFAGLDFTSNWFAEVNYQFIPSHDGVNPSGIGLQVGARF